MTSTKLARNLEVNDVIVTVDGFSAFTVTGIHKTDAEISTVLEHSVPKNFKPDTVLTIR